MYYRCYICHRPPRGFCWLDSGRHPSIAHALRLPLRSAGAHRETDAHTFTRDHHRRATFKRFCSKTCQDIHCLLYHAGVVVNTHDLEQKAAAAVLGPLADYVMSVGVEKSIGDYSKDDIVGLVDIVLRSYHDALQALYKDEVPF